MHGMTDDPRDTGVIGPNSVLQLIEALRLAGLGAFCTQVFERAGVSDWLLNPPQAMVDEQLVGRLHQTVRAMAPPGQGKALMAEAGRLTADYILANRIPRAAQVVLKLLPPRPAAALLVKAITAHSWTFAGTGKFSAVAGRPTVFTLVGNPLCAGEKAAVPVCDWHAAVFQRLFQVLVSPKARVVETECEASGGTCCRFEVDWR
ncbi:bacteriochlorophyll 4-vinyl reductase [Rhodopila globiformis]|uniref:Bacteriochlorophyll 4-vinyl reductase n=2 Tax=Rhodopila globiformis TaxID=1071 RepID=A0A2S6NNA3_RHOGL|nr:bacteriochlorophyll 4-vinyl reductase [Rhodopila globiformis]